LVQQQLLNLGYFDVDLIDSVYGINTENAIKAFQQDMRLDVEGVVGPVTWYVLFAQSATESNQ